MENTIDSFTFECILHPGVGTSSDGLAWLHTLSISCLFGLELGTVIFSFSTEVRLVVLNDRALNIVRSCSVCSAPTPTSKESQRRVRSRSKSPFRSFRWKKPKTPTEAPGSASDDESNLERAAGNIDLSRVLQFQRLTRMMQLFFIHFVFFPPYHTGNLSWWFQWESWSRSWMETGTVGNCCDKHLLCSVLWLYVNCSTWYVSEYGVSHEA